MAALSAAGAFNFFFTEPYYSLRIDSRDDVETAVLLLLVGLAVGQLAGRGWRPRRRRRRRRDLASLYGLGSVVAKGEDADYVSWPPRQSSPSLLGLVDCRLRPPATRLGVLPVIAGDGW